MARRNNTTNPDAEANKTGAAGKGLNADLDPKKAQAQAQADADSNRPEEQKTEEQKPEEQKTEEQKTEEQKPEDQKQTEDQKTGKQDKAQQTGKKTGKQTGKKTGKQDKAQQTGKKTGKQDKAQQTGKKTGKQTLSPFTVPSRPTFQTGLSGRFINPYTVKADFSGGDVKVSFNQVSIRVPAVVYDSQLKNFLDMVQRVILDGCISKSTGVIVTAQQKESTGRMLTDKDLENVAKAREAIIACRSAIISWNLFQPSGPIFTECPIASLFGSYLLKNAGLMNDLPGQAQNTISILVRLASIFDRISVKYVNMKPGEKLLKTKEDDEAFTAFRKSLKEDTRFFCKKTDYNKSFSLSISAADIVLFYKATGRECLKAGGNLNILTAKNADRARKDFANMLSVYLVEKMTSQKNSLSIYDESEQG